MDFKPLEGKYPVLLVEPYGPSIRLAIEKIGAQPGVQVAECSSALDAASLARRLSCSLILCYVAKDEDALRHLTMIKLLKAQITKKQVKFLVVSSIRDSFTNRRISQDFDAEVLIEPVSEKSLLFKVDRLKRQLSRARIEESAASGVTEVEHSAPGEGAEPFRFGPPLELESDCWLQLSGEIKRVGGRWIIKMAGPSPKWGRWVSIESNDPSTEAWQWMPVNAEDDPFIKEEGAWVFLGQKPEFLDSGWLFVSRKPQLSFFYDGQSYGSKFALEEQMLLVAKNSQAAVTSHSLVLNEPNTGEDKPVGAKPAAPGGRQREGTRLESAPEKEGVFNLSGPLELESDCWFLQSRRPRRYGGRWSVSLAGPGPENGRWTSIQADGEREGTDRYWQWVPLDPAKDPFIKEEGAWVFRGDLPRYRDDLWVFAGQSPELAFYYEGTSYGAKLLTGLDQSLLIARDSQKADQLLRLIEVAAHKVITQSATEEFARPGGAPASADASAIYKYALEHFGTVGGEWEAATLGSQQRRWYVFIPIEMLQGEGGDIRKLTAYWLYFGSVAPKVEEGEWRFADRRPQAYRSFGEVPRPIQGFLTEHFSKPESEADPFSTVSPEIGQDGLLTEVEALPVERTQGNRTFDAEVFGNPGGEWEAVGEAGQQRRWYLFLPIEVVNGVAGDIRRQPAYWTYFGTNPPRKESAGRGTRFVFELRDPQRHERFADLPRPAQEFLVQFFSEQNGPSPGGEQDPATGSDESTIDDFPAAEATSAAEPFIPVLRQSEKGSAADTDTAQTSADADPHGRSGSAPKAREFEAGPTDGRATSRPKTDDPGADPTIPSLPAAKIRREGDGTATYLFRVEDIGDPGGEWEATGAVSAGRKLYAYIPVELLHNVAEDVRKIGRYWVFAGSSKPKLVTHEGERCWAFSGREPQVFSDFRKLDSGVQRFLLEYFESKFNSLLRTPEVSLESGVAPDYVEHRSEAGGGTYLNYNEKREGEGGLDYKTFGGRREEERNRSFKVEMPSGVGPKMIRAPRPPGPSLSPLAVAFLLSELICKQDTDRAQIGQKYCEYLAASFGGLRVELWACASGTWFCAGVSDAAEGVEAGYGSCFEPGSDLAPGFKPCGVFLAPLPLVAGGGVLLGALAIGGEGAELVSREYALAVVQMARGLLLTLSGEDRGLMSPGAAA